MASGNRGTSRCLAGLAFTIALLLCTSLSQAVVLEVTDLSVSDGLIWDGRVFVPPGQTFSIGSRVSAPPAEQLQALGLSYYGYDDSLIAYDSIQLDAANSALFGSICIAGGIEFGGMSVFSPAGASPAFFGAFEGNERVRVYNGGLVGQPVTYTLANSAGIDGVCGGGDADFRVTFDATTIGETVITIGTGDDLGGAVVLPDGSAIQATNAEVRVYVPEPAFGLGLGLAFASFASGGRAHRRRLRLADA